MVGLVGLVLSLVLVVAVCLLVWRRAAARRIERPGEVAASVLTASAHRDNSVAREVEAAMAAAVRECLARGVSMRDAATIRTAVLEARERVLAQRH